MRKRIISVLLVIIISILAMPVLSVSAKNDSHINSEDFIINKIGNSDAEIIGYTGTEKRITLPAQIEGFTIVKIGKSAFSHSDIESIVLPETIKTIEPLAFEDCKQLQFIKFTGQKPEISDTAFSNVGSVPDVSTRLFVPRSWNSSDVPADSTTQWHGGKFNLNFYSSENMTGTSTSAHFLNASSIIIISVILLFVGTIVVLTTVITRDKKQKQ